MLLDRPFFGGSFELAPVTEVPASEPFDIGDFILIIGEHGIKFLPGHGAAIGPSVDAFDGGYVGIHGPADKA